MTDKPYTTEIPTAYCPSCKTQLDCASDMKAANKPKPGDYTVCIRCGHILIFGAGLKLRELNDSEIVQIAGERHLIEIQKARALMIKAGLMKPWEPPK